jgi:DNA-binding transcriptional LysR family regulator
VLNVHHLELFYYVAVHGGISSAVRHMPYGIQQPAVSGQISQLEKHLGTRLFERQPFRLTAAGEELYAFVEPFFSRLDAVEERLRGAVTRPLRIGASEVVLRLHLPAVLERLRHHHASVRLGLRSGFDTELAAWLRDGEVDFVVTPLAGKPPPRTRSVSLLRLPLALLVPKRWAVKSAADLWSRRVIPEPLISMPPRESVSLVFQCELRRRGLQWAVTIEASSIELITQYVADGRGAGVTVMLPEIVRHPRVRVLPLADFPLLEIAALWHGEPSPMLRALLEEGRQYTRERWPEPAPGAAGAGVAAT